MSDILKQIEDTNDILTNRIIDIIRDEKDLFIKLGLSESVLKIKKSTSNLIRKQISNPANRKTIDLILKYVITGNLIKDDEIPLIKHV
ncbi:hypothetical protein ACFQ5N_01045 [Lutibacter holmesii]|uniref:Uncharacterized protein n=1 Tax=Lutibacter holmesii TaxID=1137985 RepID=A0ABW3WJE8_9FLAO